MGPPLPGVLRLSSIFSLLALVLAAGRPSTAQALGPDERIVGIHGVDAARFAELNEAIDVWTEHLPPGGDVVARVSLEQLAALRRSGLEVEVDEERTARYRRSFERLPGQVAGIPGFPCYRTVAETYASLAQIAAAHPQLAAWNDIGDSWEKLNGGPGDDIPVLVLGNRDITAPKAPFVMIAAMHAREYATAELATRFAEYLVNGYGVDADVTWILDHVEVHIIPQLNPDGRKKAETGLLWRKNVDNNYCSNTNNRGVDLNRNSTYFWGGFGSSSTQCSETYRGPSAVSEPETGTIESYLTTVFPDQRGPNDTDPAPATATGVFLSLHSYGELALFPWEGILNTTPNFTELQTLGRKFGYFNRYTVCQTCYPATAGTTVDDAYGVFGVAAYTFELGTDFFESCANFQNPILPDNLKALVYAVKAARRPYQDPKGPEVINLVPSGASVPQGTLVTLTGTADDTRYFSNGQGNEPVQAVASALYTIDQAPWETPGGVALAPADGSFNTSVEGLTGTIDTSGLALGRHLVYVTGTDSAGNTGVPTAVFLDVTAPAASADVSVSQTDAPDPALAGGDVTYDITVANAGPSAATGVTLTDTLPAGTVLVSTNPPSPACTASAGVVTCDLGTLVSGASAAVSVVVQTASAGTITNAAVVAAAEPDPSVANNADSESTTVVAAPVDLAVSQTDAPDPALAGGDVTYAITVSNGSSGPATGVTLSDTLPAGATLVSTTPGTPTCGVSAGTVTCALGGLAAGASANVSVTVRTAAAGTLTNLASVSGNESDPSVSNNTATESTTVVADTVAELVHGSARLETLEALPGPTPDTDLFRILQQPWSSYEVVVDATSGDIGAGAGPGLDLVASDGATVLRSSSPIGAGSSRSLRWENAASASVMDPMVRVRSAGCQGDCGPSSVYRIRAYDTTARVARFNNSATQSTVLVLENSGSVSVGGHVWLWGPAGSLLASQPFSLAPKATFVLSTAGLAPGTSGSLGVSHDGRYGDLVGKAVAVEPATGFTFDTPLVYRPEP